MTSKAFRSSFDRSSLPHLLIHVARIRELVSSWSDEKDTSWREALRRDQPFRRRVLRAAVVAGANSAARELFGWNERLPVRHLGHVAAVGGFQAASDLLECAVAFTEGRPRIRQRIWVKAADRRLSLEVSGELTPDASGHVVICVYETPGVPLSDQHYEEILRNAPVGFFQTSPEGALLNANLYFAKTCGCETPQELIEAVNKTGIQSLYGNPLCRPVVARRALESSDWQQFEGQFRRRDNSFGYGRMRLRSIKHPSSTGKSIEGFMEDITDQRLSEARRLREQRLEGLAQLSVGVAHQFNNINTVVLGGIDNVLQRGGVTDQQRRSLESARRAVERGASITQRLQILFHGPERPRHALLLNDVVTRCLETTEVSSLLNGIALHRDFGSLMPVDADYPGVEFVVRSLVSNAAHALLHRPSPLIVVRTHDDQKYSCVQVVDNGCGIAIADLPKIFTPFFTTKGEWAAPGSPLGQVRGLGLDLAVARGLVAGLGGSLSIEKQRGARD